jgi:AraC family transcriptional regulator
MSMLGPGKLFGQRLSTLQLDDATLAETHYLAGAHLPRHAHELSMFVFVSAGSFDERFEARDRSCRAGQLLFRPSGERHANRFLARGSACLTIELSHDDGRALRDADGRLPLGGQPALLAMRVYDEFRRRAPDPLELEELLSHLTVSAARRRPLTERRVPAWLRATEDAIDAGFRQPLRLAELARNARVHRVHLSRTFHRFFGCGVAEFVRRRRVHEACALMRQGGRRLSSIAAEVGFSDESHMGRAFREVMSCTPRQYTATHESPNRFMP